MSPIICRRCNLPLEGEAAFDPDPPDAKPSYVHRPCADAITLEVNARRRRMEELAPRVYDALKACMAYIPGSEIHSWPPGHALKHKAIKMAHAVITEVEGR